MYRISEVLLSLQQAGNIKYIGWVYQIPCSTKEDFLSPLQSQARRMEDELRDWKKAVFDARNRFYELNYFTTIQLLTLRQELGALNNATHTGDVPPHVLMLLHSISSQVTSENVRKIVREVADPFSTVGSPPILEHSTAEEDERSVKTPILIDTTGVELGRSDRPTLNYDALTDEQKDIMAYVIQRANCSPLLVLKAFEECKGKDMNRFEYKKWCSDNIGKYNYEDEEVSLPDDDSESQQSSDEAEFAEPSFLAGNYVHMLQDKMATFLYEPGLYSRFCCNS